MAKLTTHLPYVKWRDGRPRFSPGPAQRALGFKGEDLRHGPAGAWFSVDEAAAWARDRQQAIAGAVATKKASPRGAQRGGDRAKLQDAQGFAAQSGAAAPTKTSGPPPLAVVDLFDLWFASPRMSGKAVQDGKRNQKPAAPATIASYRKARLVLEEFDPVLATAPAEALTKPTLYALYEDMWAKRGLHMSRAAMATLSAALSWGMKRGRLPRMAVNPCFNLGMETPDGRLRCLTPQEVRCLVATADKLGRPEIGDAIILGVWTGQRQSDRLQLVDAGLIAGRRMFRQQKTGAIVELKQTPELEARLAAARARRSDWKVVGQNVILDEQARQPFKSDHYRHVYAQVRVAAAATLPSLADARDQDLRDTAVTWLARAQCTHMEVAMVTGHAVATVQAILKHYLASHPEMSDNALDKLVRWYDAQGEA